MRAGEHNPFPYPPIFLLMLAPLGGLRRAAAFALFMGATFVFYLWASIGGRWRAWPRLLGALAAPATGVNLIFGQTGFLAGGFMLGGLALAERRPIAAGVLLGLLAYKPQLGVLVPVALVAAAPMAHDRRRRRDVARMRRRRRPPSSAPASGRCGLPRWSPIRSMPMVDRLMPTIAGSSALGRRARRRRARRAGRGGARASASSSGAPAAGASRRAPPRCVVGRRVPGDAARAELRSADDDRRGDLVCWTAACARRGACSSARSSSWRSRSRCRSPNSVLATMRRRSPGRRSSRCSPLIAASAIARDAGDPRLARRRRRPKRRSARPRPDI